MRDVCKTTGTAIVIVFLLSAIVFAANGAGAQKKDGGESVFAYRGGQTGQQMPVAQMTVQELKARIDQGKELIIIDISTAGEFREGHIKGAIHLDPRQMRGKPESFVNDLGAGKEDTLVFVCQTGNVSRRAAMIFKDEGFNHVYNLGGGKIAWLRAGYPLAEGEI